MMARWEYKVASWKQETGGAVGHFDDLLTAMIRDETVDGWDLVGVVPIAQKEFEGVVMPTEVVLILRRQHQG